MASSREKKREARVLLATWVALIASTIGSFLLADAGASPDSGAGIAGWVLGFAALKSLLIGAVFMEMRHGPRAWGFVMFLFLLAEAALLAAILP